MGNLSRQCSCVSVSPNMGDEVGGDRGRQKGGIPA